MTGGAQEQGQGQIGGSVLSRTIAGKVVEERPRNWLGTLARGRAEGPGSWQWPQALPLWHNLLPQLGSGAGRITPVSGPSKGCEFSWSPQPIHFLWPRKETSEKGDGWGGAEGRDTAHATAPLPGAGS